MLSSVHIRTLAGSLQHIERYLFQPCRDAGPLEDLSQASAVRQALCLTLHRFSYQVCFSGSLAEKKFKESILHSAGQPEWDEDCPGFDGCLDPINVHPPTACVELGSGGQRYE